MMTPSWKAGFAFALGALCAFSWLGCSPEASGSSKKGKKKGADVVPVTLGRVVARDVPIEIQVIGNVEAYSTVSIKPRVTGVIEKIYFNEGDYVRKGDRLFQIDPVPFQTALSQAEANLEREKAQLRQARANLSRDLAQQKFLASQAARFAALQKEGVISREQAEQYQASADVAAQAVAANEAAIASAEAAVQAGEAAVKTARIMLGYTSIFSPIDGRTGRITAKEGNLATANVTELAAVNQVEPIYVAFAVPESQLPAVKEAMARGPLAVLAAPPDDASNPETGRLTFVDNSVDPSTGTIRLKATFDNPRHRLWPGQFVRVTLRLGTRKGALLVPNQAVQTGQNGPYVYRVLANQTVEAATIKTAGRVDQDIVVQEGLQEGDLVVTEGQLRLAAGMRIRARGEGVAANGAGSGDARGGRQEKKKTAD